MKTIAADVRPARSRDAAALAALHEATWRHAYSGLIPHRPLRAMLERRGEAWWARAIGNGASILVMDFGGEVVGYATLGRNRTPALLADGEVYELYLLPRFQGLGFGRRLFEAARLLLRARGMPRVAVWALSDNEGAVRFYRAVGGFDVAAGSETFDGVTLAKTAFTFL